MKSIIIIFFLLSQFVSYSQPCAPRSLASGVTNPPNKLCYNYDKSGNRTGQNPSWIDYEYPYYCPNLDCTPNDPDYSYYPFRGRYFYPPFSSEEAAYNYQWSPINWTYWNWQDDGSTGGATGNTDQKFSRNDPPQKSTNIEINIVPNPNVGQFRVEQKGFDIENSKIKIYDSKSRLLFIREYVNGEVNISEFDSGVYFLILSDGIHEKTVRFVKKE